MTHSFHLHSVLKLRKVCLKLHFPSTTPVTLITTVFCFCPRGTRKRTVSAPATASR